MSEIVQNIVRRVLYLTAVQFDNITSWIDSLTTDIEITEISANIVVADKDNGGQRLIQPQGAVIAEHDGVIVYMRAPYLTDTGEFITAVKYDDPDNPVMKGHVAHRKTLVFLEAVNGAALVSPIAQVTLALNWYTDRSGAAVKGIPANLGIYAKTAKRSANPVDFELGWLVDVIKEIAA